MCIFALIPVSSPFISFILIYMLYVYFVNAISQISLHKRALRTRMKLKTIFSFSAALGGISSLQASAAARRLKEVSEDATKTNEAENSPTASPGLEASKEDPCTIAVAAAAGAKTLQVSHIRGRFEGESIVINQGGATEEVAVVAGFGSIVLQSPLRYDHAVGEIIVTNKTQELSAIEARLYEALDGTDLSLIQVNITSCVCVCVCVCVCAYIGNDFTCRNHPPGTARFSRGAENRC